ncbi:lysine--tRNA ligase [Propionicimonas sp.]|uniref:lysine--tRNA ligase n=1 Tax=Propionicimonas sp. TaxID=1955623 RepID=UPI0039E4DE64
MTEPTPAHPSLSEQEQVRHDKRARLLADGIAPYPIAVPRTHSAAQVHAQWGGLEAGAETADVVSVSGRVVFVRNTGKLCFATIQDGFTQADSGVRLQVMLSLAEVGQERLDAWKAEVDLGDFVSVTGRVISSKRGELSVLATGWVLASKALRPLPTLHKELGEETRVRQRYADLVARPEARDMVRTRAAVTRSIRETLHAEGYLEIETPVLQLVHGGAAARPFNTHLNAFDIDMTMRIALELFLKRAMVGGADRVYEIGRIFRNEGIDSSHSAEFTMLEAYQAWGDQFSIADLTRRVIQNAADAALGTRLIGSPAGEIDLDGEWEWKPVHPTLSAAVGEEITPATDASALRRIADAHAVVYDPAWPAQKLVMELFGEIVEPTLLQPTFVCDYPPIAQPLARQHRSDPDLIEAWDLIVGGVERATGFSELIDPVIQRERLVAQSLKAAAGDPEAMQLDEDFLAALEFGAPPMGGMGLGLDRVMMLLTGHGIRETILFPLLKPQA